MRPDKKPERPAKPEKPKKLRLRLRKTPEAVAETHGEAGIAGGGGDRGRFGGAAQTTAVRAVGARTGDRTNRRTREARQTPKVGGTGGIIQADRQAEADARLLHERVGVDRRTAWGLALLVMERRTEGGCSVGYVAEVIEYASSAPGVRNPAGCVVELIRRNERRRPPKTDKPDKPGQPSSRSSWSRQSHEPFDIEKYTTGKYSFLFQRQLQRQAERQSQQEDPNRKGKNEVVDRDNTRGHTDAEKDGGENEQRGPRTEHLESKL